MADKSADKFDGKQDTPFGEITIYWQEEDMQGWYVSENEEGYDEGPYDTSDDAMRDFIPWYPSDGPLPSGPQNKA